jgi:putative nucleotidyltransferase with HDIG domain
MVLKHNGATARGAKKQAELPENGLKESPTLGEGIAQRLNAGMTYRQLEALFKEVEALKGMDQENVHHSLTADRHTEEVAVNLSKEPAYCALSKEEKDWATLATYLHDIGKGHPDGRQEDEENGGVKYAGHAKVSAALAEGILPHFDISEEGKAFVLTMVKNHTTLLELIDPFQKDDQPKRKQLGTYDDFLSELKEMPGSESSEGLLRNVRLMLAFARADVKAGVDEKTALQRPDMVKEIGKNVKILDRMEMAFPAIIEAVAKRREGVQKAGIAKKGNKYVYKDYGEDPAGYDMAALSKAFGKRIPKFVLGMVRKMSVGEISEEEFLMELEKRNLGEHIPEIKELLVQHRK